MESSNEFDSSSILAELNDYFVGYDLLPIQYAEAIPMQAIVKRSGSITGGIIFSELVQTDSLKSAVKRPSQFIGDIGAYVNSAHNQTHLYCRIDKLVVDTAKISAISKASNGKADLIIGSMVNSYGQDLRAEIIKDDELRNSLIRKSLFKKGNKKLSSASYYKPSFRNDFSSYASSRMKNFGSAIGVNASDRLGSLA